MNKKYITSLICASALCMSCVNDLDVQPLDKNIVTDEIAYSDEASYYKGLMKVYSILAISGQADNASTDIVGLDAGNSQFLRSFWNLQEVSTDEAKNAWGDSWAYEINTMMWSDVKNESIEGAYQRLMYIIALANEYMGQIDKRGESDEVRAYRHEARFLRALSYYFLMDVYGNPPFITESNYSLQPSQIGRAQLFDWIESECNELVNLLPETAEYGRASKYAAYALLSRMYLNAEVYTGTAHYTECIEASKKVLAAGYSLAPSYRNLFIADNDKNGAQVECIFPIVFDGQTTQTYGGTTYLVQSPRAYDECTTAESGLISGGWGGNRATAVFVKKFEYADNENPTAASILDSRGDFFDANRTINIKILKEGFLTDGWAVYKFKNVDSEGQPGSNGTFVDTDFFLFRLGEIYLNYAEAVVRGGTGGDLSTAATFVSRLRERGYGEGLGAVNSAALTLDFILDERARELHWEGVRRTDLIRFGDYTSNTYLWEWKGGVANGTGLAESKNIYPIPVSDLSVNGNLVQNEDY